MEAKYVELKCTVCKETYVTKAVAKGTSKYCFNCKDEIMDRGRKASSRKKNGSKSTKTDA